MKKLFIIFSLIILLGFSTSTMSQDGMPPPPPNSHELTVNTSYGGAAGVPLEGDLVVIVFALIYGFTYYYLRTNRGKSENQENA